MENKEISLAEKEKRKEVAKRRTFWFLLIFNIFLIGYIVFQVFMIIRG